MAELDTRIYGELQIPPIRTMEQREAAQAARDTAELNRDIAQQKQSEIARASQANAALRQAMARFPNDPQKATVWLTQNGYGDAALELTDAFGKARKSEFDAEKSANDARKATRDADERDFELIAKIEEGMTDEKGYQWARPRLLAIDPKLADLLPEQFNPDTPKRFQAWHKDAVARFNATSQAEDRDLTRDLTRENYQLQAEDRDLTREVTRENYQTQSVDRGLQRQNQAAIAAANRANQAAIASANRAARPSGAAGEVDAGLRGMAEMVAADPSILQGKTPTVVGQVMRVVAADPELRKKFQDSRLTPLRERSKTILSAVDKLVTTDKDGNAKLSSGGQAIFGEYTPAWARSWVPGQQATDANAALQQVMGQQIVDLIGDMKAQSRTGATGFGQLSIRELDVLQSAATQLTHRLSQPAALQQLTAIKSGLNKILKDEDGTTTIKEETLAKTPDGAVKIGGFTVREKVAP